MACLDDLTIANLVGNALGDDARATALAHLDDCRSCCGLVAALAVGSPRAGADAVRLAPGTEVGRYIVERVVGAGAMGVVYAARDPSLDRAVALKCVAATGDARAKDRMLREARAMAQLSHRNVVSIFDVGTIGDDVFLAMELLPGKTLRAWLAERERGMREIVATLAGAGRGLAAAHAAGIVHRDVKPENMLVSDDGRACITDFGLAFADPAPGELRDGDVTDLTATGQVVGTPLYMAPELLAGRAADPRSDQFAFCAVLYESLAGQRAFSGRTISELRTSIARGPAPSPRIPARLQRVITRGLAVEPAWRFPSMTALLGVLARDPAVRRRRAAIVAGVAVVAAGAGFMLARTKHDDPCPDPRPSLAGAWDDARRAQLASAFATVKTPFTQIALDHTTAVLDRYADTWVSLRHDVCRATYERRDQSEARYDAELACLDQRRSDLTAAVDVLAGVPDSQKVRNALAIVQGLADVRPCRDGETLVGQMPLPADPITRAQIASVQQQVTAAKVLARVGKLREAHELADLALARARTLAFPRALADALYVRGMLQLQDGDAKVAEAALNEAAVLAATAKDDVLAAHLWSTLAYMTGTMGHRFPEAESLGRVARAAVQRAGDRDDLVMEWHTAIGAVALEQARYDDAVAHFVAARDLAERSSSPDLADQLSKLAGVLDAAGKFDDARAAATRGLALLEANLGPDHPNVAEALEALGVVDYDAGKYEDARKDNRRALAILEKLGEPATYLTSQALEGIANAALALGDLDEARAQHERVLAMREHANPHDPHVGDSLINLGMVLFQQGHVADARKDFERALTVYTEAYGPQHRQVAQALLHIAQTESGTEAAVQKFQSALTISTTAVGPDHPDVGVELGNLAETYTKLHRFADAETTYHRAIANSEKAYGADHPMTAFALTGLGQVQIELGHTSQAVASLERALAIHTATSAPPSTLGLARALLARALWNTDRTRARALAAQARTELADAHDPGSIEALAMLEKLGR